jgi:hypothetical protein
MRTLAIRPRTYSTRTGTDVTTVLGRKRSRAFNASAGLVVEHLGVPLVDHELRDHDGDEIVGILGVELVEEGEHGPGQSRYGE